MEIKLLNDAGTAYCDPLPYDEVLAQLGISEKDFVPNQEFVRVTGVLHNLPAPGLMHWYAKMAAKDAYENFPIFNALDWKEAGIKYAINAPNRYRDNAAERGTAVHDLAERDADDVKQVLIRLIEGEKVGDLEPEWSSYVNALNSFLEEYGAIGARLIWAEIAVFSRRLGIAGRGDLWMWIPGRGLYTVDIKTSNYILNKYALQTWVYTNADYAIIDGRRVPLPPIEGEVILHIKADGTYEMQEIEYNEQNLPRLHVLEALQVIRQWENQGPRFRKWTPPSQWGLGGSKYVEGRKLSYVTSTEINLAAVNAAKEAPIYIRKLRALSDSTVFQQNNELFRIKYADWLLARIELEDDVTRTALVKWFTDSGATFEQVPNYTLQQLYLIEQAITFYESACSCPWYPEPALDAVDPIDECFRLAPRSLTLVLVGLGYDKSNKEGPAINNVVGRTLPHEARVAVYGWAMEYLREEEGKLNDETTSLSRFLYQSAGGTPIEIIPASRGESIGIDSTVSGIDEVIRNRCQDLEARYRNLGTADKKTLDAKALEFKVPNLLSYRLTEAQLDLVESWIANSEQVNVGWARGLAAMLDLISEKNHVTATHDEIKAALVEALGVPAEGQLTKAHIAALAAISGDNLIIGRSSENGNVVLAPSISGPEMLELLGGIGKADARTLLKDTLAEVGVTASFRSFDVAIQSVLGVTATWLHATKGDDFFDELMENDEGGDDDDGDDDLELEVIDNNGDSPSLLALQQAIHKLEDAAA